MIDTIFALNLVAVLILMTTGLLTLTVLFAADDCARMIISYAKRLIPARASTNATGRVAHALN
jgi:hypothetical protein